MHESLTGSSIYSSGRAPQHTITSVNIPMVCIVLFQKVEAYKAKL